MSSEPSPKAAPHHTLDRRGRQLLARFASGAGLASALSALSACGCGGPDDDAPLRAVNATMDVASLDQEGLEQLTSQAIGRTVGQFAITGAAYRCYLYGPHWLPGDP